MGHYVPSLDRPTLYAIDFGTSNSLVAAASAARVFPPAPLDPTAPDPTILRSVLCFPEAGGVHVGVEALMRVPVAPEKTGEPKHISVVRATDNNWAA